MLIGDFKNDGRAWRHQAEAVNMHDFRSKDTPRAVPYGIFDLARNHGTIYVGQSGDTGEFAVDAIARWWREIGQGAYPEASKLLILADCGGSNGNRQRLWKRQLQRVLSDELGLEVTVCHYPPGCSKWNPIEHRLFSFISLNWAGIPLRTLERMLALIRGTRTKTGLRVDADLLDGVYETGIRISDNAMRWLHIDPHKTCPQWNYTLRPRPTLKPIPGCLITPLADWQIGELKS